MLGGTSVDAWQASDEEYRRSLMGQELDCVSRQLSSGAGVTWKSTCSSQSSGTSEIVQAKGTDKYDRTATVDATGNSYQNELMDFPGRYSQAERQIETSWGDTYGDVLLDDTSKVVDLGTITIDVGTEISSYRYAEPEFMRLKGYMWGVFAAATLRTSDHENIKTVGDIFSGENFFNMFRADVKFSGGDLDYESEGTGKTDDLRNYMFEVRGSTGYDIPVLSSSRITPYAGFGFRYLKDDSGGNTTTTGASHYDRESFYYYVPLGVETRTKISKSWLFEMTFEYDFFLFGTQKSHLEDVLSTYNTLVNDQDEGYGARGSFKIIKQNRNFDLYFEPFVRYWNIEDSDTAIWTQSGVPIGTGLEPANNTAEYGFKMGLRY